MSRPRTSGRLAVSLSTITWGAACWLGVPPWAPAEPPAATSSQAPPASAQTSITTIVRPETLVLQALRANPVTAPYAISVTSSRTGQVVLSGTVGTRYIHDTAIRMALAYTASIRDDLRIDTAETYRVAAAAAAASAAAGAVAPAYPGLMSYGRAPYYIYPPPLFGRLDDPFFGFEPPLLSYPPWWRAVTAREPITLPAGAAVGVGPGADPNVTRIPLGSSPQDGYVEMTLDAQGVAVLRGTVPSLADRVTIGQKIAQIPGVTQVNNLLEVGRPATETPPPPPQPDPPAAPRAPVAPGPAPGADAAPAPEPAAIRPAVVADRNDLARRLTQALASRPALAGLPIELSVRDGVAYLAGRVPSVYEAMLAFRVAEQTPGVRAVEDRLEFVVPDGDRKNPLRERGRPEDVEPYLTAQLRRQVGDFAHVDQVRIRGDTLEIRGTLISQDDRPRLDAILRSMPVLRGFRLEPTFVVD